MADLAKLITQQLTAGFSGMPQFKGAHNSLQFDKLAFEAQMTGYSPYGIEQTAVALAEFFITINNKCCTAMGGRCERNKECVLHGQKTSHGRPVPRLAANSVVWYGLERWLKVAASEEFAESMSATLVHSIEQYGPYYYMAVKAPPADDFELYRQINRYRLPISIKKEQ